MHSMLALEGLIESHVWLVQHEIDFPVQPYGRLGRIDELGGFPWIGIANPPGLVLTIIHSGLST